MTGGRLKMTPYEGAIIASPRKNWSVAMEIFCVATQKIMHRDGKNGTFYSHFYPIAMHSPELSHEAPHALKGQKLLAEGIALGILAISKAPCKGKSFKIPGDKQSFCPYRATSSVFIIPRALPWARSFCPFRACCFRSLWTFSPLLEPHEKV